MKTMFRSIPAALLIMLYVYAAAVKLLTFDVFRVQLYRQPFPRPVAGALLVILPAAELLTAALIMLPKTRLAGLRLSAALLYFFTGYIVLALLHFWQKVPCPCGGILSHLGWPWHLIFNLVFIGINILAVRFYRREHEVQI